MARPPTSVRHPRIPHRSRDRPMPECALYGEEVSRFPVERDRKRVPQAMLRSAPDPRGLAPSRKPTLCLSMRDAVTAAVAEHRPGPVADPRTQHRRYGRVQLLSIRPIALGRPQPEHVPIEVVSVQRDGRAKSVDADAPDRDSLFLTGDRRRTSVGCSPIGVS